jgi:hypothetical protein
MVKTWPELLFYAGRKETRRGDGDCKWLGSWRLVRVPTVVNLGDETVMFGGCLVWCRKTLAGDGG